MKKYCNPISNEATALRSCECTLSDYAAVPPIYLYFRKAKLMRRGVFPA